MDTIIKIALVDEALIEQHNLEAEEEEDQQFVRSVTWQRESKVAYEFYHQFYFFVGGVDLIARANNQERTERILKKQKINLVKQGNSQIDSLPKLDQKFCFLVGTDNCHIFRSTST